MKKLYLTLAIAALLGSANMQAMTPAERDADRETHSIFQRVRNLPASLQRRVNKAIENAMGSVLDSFIQAGKKTYVDPFRGN